MRIVGGTLGGRKINMPVAATTRPTTDFVREALFNILEHRFDLSEVAFLDLFAGTGAISFEMASRSCEHISLVEKNFHAVQYIKAAAAQLKIENIKIIKSDVYSFIKQSKESYDLVFADPPYQDAKISFLPQIIREAKIVKKSGVFILEHSKKNNFSEIEGFEQERAYGNSLLSFFQF